jgi:hypothetical protein
MIDAGKPRCRPFRQESQDPDPLGMQDFNARVLRRGEEVGSWMATCYILKLEEKEREFPVSDHDGAVVH